MYYSLFDSALNSLSNGISRLQQTFTSFAIDTSRKFVAAVIVSLISVTFAARVTQRPRTPSSTPEPPSSSGQCCAQALYPDNKVWIQADGTKLAYTFYDPYGTVERMTVNEVDSTGATTAAKLVDADQAALACPANHRTTNPKHADLTKNSHAKLWCLNKDNKMARNKWYAVCRDRGCTACHLDRSESTNEDPQYVKVKSAKIQGNSLVMQFSVEPAGVNYNVSVEAGVVGLTQFTITPSQRTYNVQIPNVAEGVYSQPIYLFVDPWVKSPAGCPVMGRKQVTTMAPMTRSTA